MVMTTTNEQPGEPSASLLVEHWAKQTFAIATQVNQNIKVWQYSHFWINHIYQLIFVFSHFHLASLVHIFGNLYQATWQWQGGPVL